MFLSYRCICRLRVVEAETDSSCRQLAVAQATYPERTILHRQRSGGLAPAHRCEAPMRTRIVHRPWCSLRCRRLMCASAWNQGIPGSGRRLA